MEALRTQAYTRAIKRLVKLGASAADIDVMEVSILATPQAGVLVRGGGGLRKVRFGYGGAGKRGGGRTIYFVAVRPDRLYLISAYAKVDAHDISAADLRLYRQFIKELGDER